jgi:amidase
VTNDPKNRRPNEWSAVEAAAAIRAGRLTSLELVEACLARIAEREDRVGAWECLDAERARGEARRCDAEAPRGPLHGVPIGVKDIIDTEALPTARGSPLHAGRRPDRDADCVARARQAGAIVLGKTVTTELAYFQPGKTANPLRLSHTPGGSSSGSAAAVADAMVPLAFGSQTAGSINRPAAYCGIVGYKPTFGEVDLAGVLPFAPSLDTLGVLARSVADVALMRRVLVPAPHAASPATGGRQLRIALCRTPWWSDADAAVRTGIERACAQLQAGGIDVGEATLPPAFAGLVDAQKSIMAFEAAASLAVEYERDRDRLSAPLRELIAAGLRIDRERHARDLAARDAAQAELAHVFADWDVLLTPSTHGEAPAGLHATGDPLFSRAWTLLGVPTLTVPAFHGPSGLPIGLQLVAARANDGPLLQAGATVESALGFPHHPSSFRSAP